MLTIAGSDSGGGAGIQADLKTFAALDCHGVSAIAAVTAQNTRRVTGVWQVPIDSLRAQLDAVSEDFNLAAIKIGMLGNRACILEVASFLERTLARNVILDPVMVATSGDSLLERDALECLRAELLPRADLITPNLPEAMLLLGRGASCLVGNTHELEAIARQLLGDGARAVLLKGGHARASDDGRVRDIFVDRSEQRIFENARLAVNAHGTGCALSSACAAWVARGEPLADAAGKAIDFVHRALAHAFYAGSGDVAVLNHFAAGRELA